MGRFEKYIGDTAPDEPTQPQALPQEPVPTGGRFSKYLGGAPSVPPQLTPSGQPRRAPNQPFGELKSYDPSPSERYKNAIQDALIGAGAHPYNAGALANIANTYSTFLTPMGSILSAADLPHDISQQRFGHATLDLLGAAPLIGPAIRRLRGITPNTAQIPALAPPPWARNDPTLNRGWVTPSTEELVGRGPRYGEPVGTAQQAYADTRNSQVLFHPRAGEDFALRAMNHIESPAGGSFAPEGVPGVYSILDRYATGRRYPNQPLSASELDDMRQQLRNLEGKEGAAGRNVAGLLDQYMSNPPPGAVILGGPQDLAQLRAAFDKARGDYRAGMTARTVEGQIDYAGTRAGAAHSGMNVGNTTRQKMANLVSPTSDAIFGAAPAERAALDEVARTGGFAPKPIPGTDALSPEVPTSNALRIAANRLGGGGGWAGMYMSSKAGGLAGAGGYFLGGLDPLTSAGLGIASAGATTMAGRALKQVENERTVEAAHAASDFIRRNSPEFADRLAANGPPVQNPQMRDAVAYALMPQAANAGKNAWDQMFTPYTTPEGYPYLAP